MLHINQCSQPWPASVQLASSVFRHHCQPSRRWTHQTDHKQIWTHQTDHKHRWTYQTDHKCRWTINEDEHIRMTIKGDGHIKLTTDTDGHIKPLTINEDGHIKMTTSNIITNQWSIRNKQEPHSRLPASLATSSNIDYDMRASTLHCLREDQTARPRTGQLLFAHIHQGWMPRPRKWVIDTGYPTWVGLSVSSA